MAGADLVLDGVAFMVGVTLVMAMAMDGVMVMAMDGVMVVDGVTQVMVGVTTQVIFLLAIRGIMKDPLTENVMLIILADLIPEGSIDLIHSIQDPADPAAEMLPQIIRITEVVDIIRQ